VLHLHGFNDDDFLIASHGIAHCNLDFKDGAKNGGDEVVLLTGHAKLFHIALLPYPIAPLDCQYA
jgi:hypothetical protein